MRCRRFSRTVSFSMFRYRDERAGRAEQLISRSSRLPIVFITAHDELGMRERATSAGALAFLRKPFNDKVFIKTLTAAVKRGTDGRQGGVS
jgi:FixJ family two-component response regulator